MELHLADWQSADQWRWVLKDDNGQFLADHAVRLDKSAEEYAALTDLPVWLARWRGVRSDADSLEKLGAWLGEQLFGKLRDTLREQLQGAAVVIPIHLTAQAQPLVYYPLELAHLDGQPLAAQGIRFIYRFAAPRGDKAPVKDALRVLAVFSLPDGETPLNLRRERYQLKQLLNAIAQTQAGAVELRELQYGATRATLKEALRDGPGWDVIHFSGHGHNGLLVLENDAGNADIVTRDDLLPLLRLAQPRLKLLTLSACHSGANLRGQAALALALQGAGNGAANEITELPGLAQQLGGELDCAVLAMRYSVGDQFAEALALGLYRELLEHHQPLPGALQLALQDALESRAPALSVGTPLLFGARAEALQLAMPPGSGALATSPLYTHFPREPERFVGRLQAMLQASRALATGSPHSGVLFHGMAGAGKTACALELAWRHEQRRFTRWVWHKAPDQGGEIHNALLDFLTAVETQIGLPIGDLTANLSQPELFRARTLPHLKALLAKNAICIVIDNLEGLLSVSDTWRDDAWGPLINTLLNHGGHSRLVLTSRHIPADLAKNPALLRLPITALSLGETVLLLRELPHTADLFNDAAGRDLLERLLLAVQGHPKLLELAAALAADRSALQTRLTQMEQATPQRAALQAFFEQGQSSQDESAFFRQLAEWTTSASRALPPTARRLLELLANMEETDREKPVVLAVWPELASWETEEAEDDDGAELPEELKALLAQLAQAGNDEDAPDPAQLAKLWQAAQRRSERAQSELAPALAELHSAALVEIRAARTDPHSDETTPERYGLHPAVAETVVNLTDPAVRETADRVLGEFWAGQFAHAMQNEQQGSGAYIVNAARRAIPYWLRQRAWEEASTLLEQLIFRDQSPAAFAFALPLLRSIVTATAGTKSGLENQGVLARVLIAVGCRREAETLLREGMAQAVAARQYRLATGLAGELFNLLSADNRLEEALALCAEKGDYTRAADLGPWTQLADEARRLQVLNAMGRWAEVLEQVEALLPQLRTQPESGPAEEAVHPWNVRESLLNAGQTAAKYLNKWEDALTFNAEILRFKGERGADALELAKTRYNDYGPLLNLNRYDDCRAVLEDCRKVIDKARDYELLGKVYTALAELEDQLGHLPPAIEFEQGALRYAYLDQSPEDRAISHNNLARYLHRSGAPREVFLAHLLAAVLIWLQSGSGHLQTSVVSLATLDLPATPPTFTEIVATVESLDGIRFAELCARLPARYPDGDTALAALWALVSQARAGGQAGPDMTQVLENFHPLLAAIAAVANGDETARPEIEELLSKLEENGWKIAAAVHALWAGERDEATLTAGLDESDTLLVKRILELTTSSLDEA